MHKKDNFIFLVTCKAVTVETLLCEIVLIAGSLEPTLSVAAGTHGPAYVLGNDL